MTTTARNAEYVGRHRSPIRRPMPLPMTNLDGINDAAVSLSLRATDPYVLLTSDHDQALIALSPKQVEQILGRVQESLESGAVAGDDEVDDDFDPTDAELAVDYWPTTVAQQHASARALSQELHS
ncbi:hypothetical protein [Intrasporangium flavum]|uniref:hypothetical protein n=1 Tax=Intrasporangium flavum TaxID=1428657 RepID=UPI00096E01C8|nr:hypothetical protein [Intrasporangium flavum]